MSKIRIAKTQNTEAFDPASEDTRSSPEQRLWFAVIEKCVCDWRELFAKITGQIKRTSTYNSHYAYDYRTFKHELEHQAFKEVCDLANFPHDKVLDLFEREAKASGLFSVEPRVPKFASSQIKRLRGWH